MFKSTPVQMAWYLRSKKGNMKNMLEGHFWSLTRYRIGPRLLGLDYAGNVIFFPAYRKTGFGGWTAVTLGAPGTSASSLLSSDMNAVNVLEDGYPLHHKASKKLQLFVSEEKKRWVAKQEAEARTKVEAVAKAAADAVKDSASPAAATTHPELSVEIPADLDTEQHFRDRLAIRVSNPSFYSRQLRVSRLATFLYKCLYFYLWAVLVSLIVQGYLMFRAWVNPAARAGLKNIEGHVMHVPRLIFVGCVHGVAWIVRTAQPLIDPVVDMLTKIFPQINWAAASAEKLASKAEHLANDTHPAAEKRKELQHQQAAKKEEERRTWWTRVLMVLLALFSVLCVL